MPGEQPRGAPPPTMTRGLQSCQATSGMASGTAPQPPGEDNALASRTTKAMREPGSRTQAMEPPDTQPGQAREVEPKATLQRTQPLSSPPRKGGSPRAPLGRSHTQASTGHTGRADNSPQQLCTLSISGSRARPTLDETPEGPQCEGPQPPEAEAPPAPEELSFQRCFQETPSSFTSTNYTSPSATPGPPPLRAPQSSDASPCRPASYSEFQASGADAWLPAAENNIPGASFRVLPTEPEPFPKAGSPRVASFQIPFPALPGAGPKPFPEDTAGPEYSERALVFAFHQPRGEWQEEAVGTGVAYPLPTQPAPPPPSCFSSQPGRLDPTSDLGRALPTTGAARPVPSPFSESTVTFPASLHKSLTTALPERPPSAHNGLGSPRGRPNSLPQRHFPGQAYGSPGASGVGTSPSSLDTELANPGPPPTRLPQLWDPTRAPYPTPPLGPPATTRSVFFEGQPSTGQRLGLPQSPQLPWPRVLPATRPSPHQVEMLSRLPFPPGTPEWQGGRQVALGAVSKTPGPGEKLVLRNSPGQHSSSSPGLFTYNGLQDPGAQALFFGVAQPQVSPQGTPSLPPPRLVGASPSESPLPSPATNTAGSSTCSSLSPLSSSPANPSSEESQLPGPLGPSSFFHPHNHPQENSSPFPSPDPSHALPIHYQPEPVKTFPFPTEVLGAEGTFKCLEEVPFPSAVSEVGSGGLEGFPPEPPPYSAHHFPLSSASLDQLDVLLTCKQCDRNYSSLATFLEHRQFCSLLLARTKDSHQQPSEIPRPSAAPSVLAAPKAPDPGNPSLLSHTKTVPFLLGGDLRVDGKDDPLRTTFLPNLTTAPFPLSAADLDLEDDAKLDSLITEALNGLEYQSDNPEIDSSFIDVFADEEPSGPRGTSAGLPPKTRVGGATPENKSHPPLPTMEPQAPRPGDGGYTACSRPKTRSLGPVPAEANRTSLASQQRRGKQFKFSQGELDTASTAKRSGRGTRASCLRPRRKGKRAEPAPHRPRDLRAQALKSHTDPCGRLLPVETRSSKRLRLSLRKDSRRRKAWGGTWSKELIHKIVQQKNQLHKQQAQQGQGSCFSLATERPAPSTLEGRLQEYDYASESEEEDNLQPRGSRLRGRPRHGSRRWRRGEKRKEMDLALGPREERKQQKSRKVVSPETTKPGRPCPGPSESPEGQGPMQSPETVDSPKERDPKSLLQIPTSTKTPEENHPSLDFPQEDVPPDTTKLLRDVSDPPPSTCVEGSLCPPAPEQPQPGREDTTVPHGSSALPGAGSPLGAPRCTEPPISHDKEDSPACLPGELLVPITDTTAADPEPSTLFLKTPDLGCDSALFNRDSLVPAAKMEPQPYSSPPRKLLIGPKGLAGCFPKDLYSKPLAPDTPAASSRHLCQEGVDPSSLKPKPPRNPPYTVDMDPGKAESPLTLESTPLLSGLPMDEFDSPIYSNLSGNGDAQSPPTRIDPPPRKPQLDPPYPSFLPEKGWSLLEEVSPVLSSHLDHSPDLSGAKVFSKRCPRERTTAATPPPLPCKVSKCSITFMSNLPEDELEIKRLVTELESQLQSKGVQEAPGELRGAQHTGRMRSGTGTPLPIHQAASPQKDSFSTADLTDLGQLSPHQEGAETAVATTEGTLGSPQEAWPSFHLGEAAPPPASHKDQVAGASFSPSGASLSFQPVQNTRVSRRGLPEAEEGCRGCPEACLPDPGEPLKPPSDRGKLVKCSPNHEPLFLKNNQATGIHHNKDVLLLLPCTQRGGSCKAQGPGQDAPELEGLSSPVAHLAPALAFQGAAVLHLGASPPSGTSHSEALKGHSLSSADGAEETGPLHPAAGSPGSEGNKKVVPAGASPSPGCMPNISPGRRPQDPAESPLCQLQLLVAGAAENEDDDQSLQGPQLANTQSSQQSNPSDVEGDIIECGNVAHGPGKGSDGGVQMTAISEMAGCQLRPEAGGHLGSLGQAEKLKGPGKASQLQPDNWGSLGSPDNLTTVDADPETTLASPTGAADQRGGQVRGSRPNLGLQNEAQSTPSPSSSDVESLVPASTAPHDQNGPKDWTPGAASPGLKKHLLLTGESAELPMRDLASCAPLPISAATPVPCSLEHLLQEDPPTVPSGELRGLLPMSPSLGDPTSMKHLPAYSSVCTALKRADCTPAPTDARAGGSLATSSALRTSSCGLKESLVCHSLVGERNPLEDTSTGQPSLINAFISTHVGDHPEGSMPRSLEGSKKERLRGSPAYDIPSPPSRAMSPRVTVQAAALPGIPATDGMGAVRGPRAEWPDPHCRGALPHSSPDRTPEGPSSEHPGHREGQSITTVPADASSQTTAGPEPRACREGEAKASTQGEEDLKIPGAGHPGISKASAAGTRGATVTCPCEELQQDRATSLSSTASNSRPNSPQSLRNVPQQVPQGDPLGPQDPKQKPCGFKNTPMSTESSCWKNQDPRGRPVTCEVCSATFRSGPGLSRHRARKHRLQGVTSQPSPPALAAPQSGEPAAQMSCPPGKKGRRAPGKEKPRHRLSSPSHTAGSPPLQASWAPEDAPSPKMSKGLRREVSIVRTPVCPPSQEPHPPGLVKQEVGSRPAEPRKWDLLQRDEPCPKQAERRGGKRRGRAPMGIPRESEGKSNKKSRKPRARRFREESGPPVSPDVISDRSHWNPSTATVNYPPPLSHCLSQEAEQETEVTQLPLLLATELEETSTQKSPGKWVAPPGRMEGVPPAEETREPKAALAKESWGPRETRTSGVCRELSRAAGGTPAGHSIAAKSGSGQGVWEGHKPPWGPSSSPETCGSEAGDTISSCLQGPLYNPEDRVQEHESVRDPLSLFDDEASFSQLFPLGNHLTRKKNPRVYGKRCKKPKPPPLPEPWEFQGSETLPSAHMPTDLSDSGSLCLSLEDPWSDEAMGLPESFLLEGFLSSKMPGIDPWAPGPSLWALEPDPEADRAEQEPSCSAKDHLSENIPELHMVPAAWRGLELQAPADETASSLGDVSPEPPNLEQEHYNCGLPGNAVALERLSNRFEMQDICFLGPCEDPVALSNVSFLDFKATVNSQGSRSKRPEEVAKAKRAPVRDRNARAKRTPYKCRVCFQRFHGLGELDLHKLAHSPSPPPTCYMCVERRFGSRELLREHLQEKHVQGRAGLWACGMCLREVADVWMYNEHLREHALRFARKGPARRSLGDPSGRWEGDSTVTHFLSSMMGQASKPHRGKCSVGQANGGPAEREKPKPKARTKNSNQDGTLMPDSTLAKSSPSTCANPALPSSSATLPGSTKTCPSLSPAPCPNREPLPHTVPVHQDCKDPSRDCHHCGKRFPKPFKLQRHLAVHSPQRVFLCPQCPRVYPEPCELRKHLAREHGVREELELQHTPLYDCELCANVTHISKRSFICSSCNYTFAKKEQFDRHMDKHLRRGQQPFTFRGVRRPGASGQKTQAREGSLPSKRRRVATPSSAPGPVVDRSLSLGSSPTLSEASMPALLQPCLEAAPGGTQGQPRTPERPMDHVGHLARGNKLPSDSQEFILPSLSPFPAASADGKDGHKPDHALESPPDGDSPGSPGPLLQQALPLEGFLPQPGARGQASESLFSGKGRTPSAPGKCAPDHHPEAPSMLRKEKQVSTCHVVSEGDKGVPSHKGSATKHGGCQSSSKDRPTLSIPGKAPKFPVQSKKAVASPKPGEPAHGTEDRQKPTALKAKPGPSSQGNGGPQHSTKTAGGSQPQPASGQLQSETATTPSKPNCPAQSPAPDKPPTRAPAKGYSKAPREAGDQGPQGSLVPREDREGKEKKRKGRALGPSKSESMGSLGRAPSVPDKPRRAPRKQATPSRVLPAKPRPSSQSSITLPQPAEQQRGEPSHTHRDFRRSRDGLGKAFPQARPLHRTPKRGRAVRGAEHANPRACWTAESQNDLLSQLFGQRLTSFKIPLKKDSTE